MHELEVPLALAGFQIDAHQAFRKQVVARTMAAIEIRGRRFDRQVDEPEVFVHADLAPDAGVAVLRPRSVLPRLAPELSGTRNGVELPELFAAAHVEGAHEPLGVVVRLDCAAFPERGADNRDIAGDRGRRVDADLPGLEIDLLLVAVNGADLQIDEAILGAR